MNITNEERARIFAAYYDAPVYYQYYYGGEPKERIPVLSVLMDNDEGVGKLILKPLEQITDKDAMDVAKMCGGTSVRVDGNFMQIIKYGSLLIVYYILNGNIPVWLIDKLRKMNYNIGYGSHSAQDLIDLGIVTYKTAL